MIDIVLVDRGLKIIDEILCNTDFDIAVLIVDQFEHKKKYENNKRIREIYSVLDLFKMDIVNGLDYDLIAQHKDTQLVIENSLTRFVNEYQERKYYYYKNFSFWCNIFKKYKIDAVIIGGPNHALLWDGVPHAIAKKNRIPCYTLDYTFWQSESIWDNLSDEFIPIIRYKQLNSNEVKNYLVDYQDDSFNNFERSKIKKSIYKLGGPLTFEFIHNVKILSFSKKHIGSTGITYNYFKKLKSYYYIKFLKIYLDSISEKYSPELNEKFILFAMHFEPEAMMTARFTLENQLTMIKMLSECLPLDWKIYVKEHPYQFKLNNTMMDLYINNIENFKSKRFYDIIKEIPNVRIIKTNTCNQVLIENSQAIATGLGTIATEAIDYYKPVMLFSSRTPLKYFQDYFKINSYEDCKMAIEKIENGFMPQYKNFNENFSKYVIKEYDKEYGKVIVDTIYQHLNGFYGK